MSSSELPSGASGPVNPEGASNDQAPEQPSLAPAPSASGSLYDQPTMIGSQLPPSLSGPLPQIPGSQPFQPYGSGPTMPNSQPLQSPSGAIVPMSGPLPMILPSGPLTPPSAAGASSPGWKGWALSFALFGVVLAVAGGLFFFLTPGPSPAFAKEQPAWAVNPVIGLPTLIVGLLLLVVPFVLQPFAKKPALAGASAAPAMVGAAGASGGAAFSASAPPESAPLLPASQPWPPVSGPMPQMPGSQPFQPPSGPQSWPPSGPTGPS